MESFDTVGAGIGAIVAIENETSAAETRLGGAGAGVEDGCVVDCYFDWLAVRKVEAGGWEVGEVEELGEFEG